MRRTGPDRPSIAVRGIVLVAASVLLGTAAHAAAAGHATQSFGALLVTATLLAVTVSAIVAAGAWLAGQPCLSRWASPLEDATAALGLVISQLLVHWLNQSGASAGPTLAERSGHHLSAGQAPAHSALHAGHAGWGMALAHSGAALAVGVALRWLESQVLRLAVVLRSVGCLISRIVGTLQPPLLGGVARPATARRGRWGWRSPVSLTALRGCVVRRGPPRGLALI